MTYKQGNTEQNDFKNVSGTDQRDSRRISKETAEKRLSYKDIIQSEENSLLGERKSAKNILADKIKQRKQSLERLSQKDENNSQKGDSKNNMRLNTENSLTNLPKKVEGTNRAGNLSHKTESRSLKSSVIMNEKTSIISKDNKKTSVKNIIAGSKKNFPSKIRSVHDLNMNISRSRATMSRKSIDNSFDKKRTSGYSPKGGKIKLTNFSNKIWDDLDKKKELLGNKVTLPCLVLDENKFVVSAPVAILSKYNELNDTLINEVTHEKRIDSDGNVRKIIQRQMYKSINQQSLALESTQYISRSELRNTDGAIEEIVTMENYIDLGTNHEKLKTFVKRGQHVLTVETNRFLVQDNSFLEKCQIYDNKVKIKENQIIINNDIIDVLDSSVRSFYLNRSNYYLLKFLKRKIIGIDLIKEKEQIFLGKYQELTYDNAGN